MNVYHNTVINTNGNAVSGATVTVRVAADPPASGALANIYSDDGVTLIVGSQVTTDSSGRFKFWAPDGKYDLTVSGSGITTFTLQDVEVADVTERFSTDAVHTANIYNAGTGIRINGAATAGNVLRGDGTNFVSATLALTDLSTFSSADLRGRLTDETGSGAAVFGTSPTLTQPTIADFTNAQHDHADADDGGQLTDAALSAAVGIAKGGTGQTTQTAAFDALAPTTTRGDLIVHNGADNVRLAVGTSGKFLRSDGTDPSWQTIASGDLPSHNHAAGDINSGQISAARGGTGDDTSATTGVPRIAAGNWTYDAGISHLAASTSADLRGVLSDETGGGAAVFADSPTIVTPTIASFANAAHDHEDAAGGGQLNATNVFSAGTVPTARLGSGVADATTFLRGDQTWQTLSTAAAGADTQVQFNDGGTSLGGDADLTWNKTTNALTAAGSVTSAFFSTSSGTPATTGLVRAAVNTDALCSRNSGNTANRCFKLNTGDEWDTGSAAMLSQYFEVATSEATTGGFRTRPGVLGSIVSRNAAATADVTLLSLSTGDVVQIGDAADAAGITLFNTTTAPAYATSANCADGTATPADCSAAPAGSVIISAGATAVVVNTTAVTANSQIFVMEDSSLGTRLSVTCNTTIGRNYAVTARSAGASFTITTDVAPVTNPACLSYFIVN